MLYFCVFFKRKCLGTTVGLSIYRSIGKGSDKRKRSIRHHRSRDELDARESAKKKLLLLYAFIEIL